ncbi:MAG: hypothetical protein VKP62_16295 [Candidatus Sericytochromatia bacterium]|nr:hypothetical protein [Candidatus Sericytochromatia bacterium]
MMFGIAERQAVGSATCAVLQRRYGNFEPPPTRIWVTPDSVKLSRLNSPVNGPSITILRAPWQSGASWPGRPLPDGHSEVISVIGMRDTEVPAGRFETWQVDHLIRYADGNSDVLSYWYAAGVGCVRMIERATLYVGGKPVKLATEACLTRFQAKAWPPQGGTQPSPLQPSPLSRPSVEGSLLF